MVRFMGTVPSWCQVARVYSDGANKQRLILSKHVFAKILFFGYLFGWCRRCVWAPSTTNGHPEQSGEDLLAGGVRLRHCTSSFVGN